jgi:hypothetical protein
LIISSLTSEVSIDESDVSCAEADSVRRAADRRLVIFFIFAIRDYVF